MPLITKGSVLEHVEEDDWMGTSWAGFSGKKRPLNGGES